MTDQPGPQRIRQSRRKGADIQQLSRELNGRPALSVVRGSRWGNPFTVEEHGRAEAIAQFRRLVAVAAPGDGLHPETIRRALRGYNLACYCRPNEACHADVLLAIANK
jgi:Domain of unknown function (DUF4326)